MGSFLNGDIDFAKHNEETKRVWQAYLEGRPTHVPVSVVGSIRNYFQNPELDTKGWTFQDFFERIDVHIEAQVEYQKWCRFNLLCDQEMGMPSDGWRLRVDFQNSLDAAWMGCPMVYLEGAVPDTLPILDEHKEALYEMPNIMGDEADLFQRAIAFFDRMCDRSHELGFFGLPTLPPQFAPGEGTDGPLDLAYKMRGADNLLIDMMTDPDYYHTLMGYITENLILRMKRMKEFRWKRQPDSTDLGQYRRDGFFFADDAIAMLSPAQYLEFVYPYHKRFFDEFSTGESVTMHLCGSATQHFRFLRDEFHISIFDTGFPVDHGALRKELGPHVTIQGGPTIMEVRNGTSETISREVERICRSGVMDGGRFIMIAANNIAPCTPVENIKVLYEATRFYGVYR